MTSKLDDVTPPGYTNAKRISEGAFGQVLQVEHERSGVSYAVKVLPMLKEGDKERVSREVEMLTRFAHARIVGLHESIDMGGHQAIVMELGDRSLKDLISEYDNRKELIPLPLTVMILIDICEGLLWMHTHSSGSTAHGDLKPENVLLRPNCRAFLCDLGGSAPLDQQLTSTIGEMGTFEYNSPERVMDSKGTATPASDVWSLGVLAYRMVTGKSLFEGLHLLQLSVALSQFNESKIPLSIDPSVREVLLKMLEPLATRGNEIKESLSDSTLKEKTMELEMEKQKLLNDTKELESKPRSLQMTLKRTYYRNLELEKEEEQERLQQHLTTQPTPISINPEDNILSKNTQFPEMTNFSSSRTSLSVSGRTLTREDDSDLVHGQWLTELIEEPISEGVVSVAITLLAMLSMKKDGVSVRFDGLTRLKKATPLPRVNEIKWNPEDLSDSEDMYMNGMRSSVLTNQTQMPSLVFTDPHLFRVEDNIIASICPYSEETHSFLKHKWSSFFFSELFTEGIVAISFTYLVHNDVSSSFFGLMDGSAPIPGRGQTLVELNNTISLSQERKLHFLTTKTPQQIDLSSFFENGDHIVIEINMDSTPRTAQFFVDGQSANAVVVDLPESVRVGFSTWDREAHVRFDRITNLNRGTPFTDQMKVVEWSRTRPSQEPDTDEGITNSKTEGDKVDEETDVEKKKRQLLAMKLPELLFTHKSHFAIRNNILTRTEKGTDENGRTRPSNVLLSESITKGVVSVTFVVLNIVDSMDQEGFVNFGLLDSSIAVPQLGQVLGKDVKNSFGLSTSSRELFLFSQIKLKDKDHFNFSKKARVVMEVNMDSNPRTVQFFVNGKVIERYLSEIPESVRIGFSADVMGTSVQITNIAHSTQPTPLAAKMIEIKWTDTEQSLEARKEKPYSPIRREAEGSMPALLCRNSKHFKIEGNVITRTTFGFNGLTSPFSTVVIDEVFDDKIMCVAITILALPRTENSRRVVMLGGLWGEKHVPKSPKGLGFGKNGDTCSFALCSLDGVLYSPDLIWLDKPHHPPLQVGDQVVLEVKTDRFGGKVRFNMNGKLLLGKVSHSLSKPTIGFSLAGPGTSIRIDSIAESSHWDEPSSSHCSCRIL
ncbi:putative CAMK family protein kinase [Blattamonas nauphoetae]|uniref:CAMK family protein kinase n=1 Tax=Blattamonas nauphoetae TaxID=2049346 RepID=A0ABQ9XTN8_9EUKA|nr:putative CAMK family protein kinase [Blattamonas nauphoetae]